MTLFFSRDEIACAEDIRFIAARRENVNAVDFRELHDCFVELDVHEHSTTESEVTNARRRNASLDPREQHFFGEFLKPSANPIKAFIFEDLAKHTITVKEVRGAVRSLPAVGRCAIKGEKRLELV